MTDLNVLPLPDTIEVPHLLSPEQTAKLLGVSERTLERWRISGEGPRYVTLSRKVIRYQTEHLRAFLAERTKSNTAQ